MLGRRGSLRFLVAPPFAWLTLLFVAPLLLAIAISFRPGLGPINVGNIAQFSLLQYQKVVEQSVREVSDALIGRREFGEVRNAQREQVESLREVNRVSLRRYEAGVASYFEVIDAQRELLAAELALAQAQRNALVSSVQLYKALGGGWQVEGGKR